MSHAFSARRSSIHTTTRLRSRPHASFGVKPLPEPSTAVAGRDHVFPPSLEVTTLTSLVLGACLRHWYATPISLPGPRARSGSISLTPGSRGRRSSNLVHASGGEAVATNTPPPPARMSTQP